MLQNQENFEIIEVKTAEDLDKFISLPYKIYFNNPNWPGQIDAVEMFLHNQNEYFPHRYIETQLFLAIKDGETLGRISATINEVFDQKWKEDTGFFGHFECVDDQNVANGLFSAVEQWVRTRGKKAVTGSFNYTYYGVMGTLINAFDRRPTIDLAYNPDYYPRLIENAGYIKRKDLVEILAPVKSMYQRSRERLAEMTHISTDPKFSIRTINKNQLQDELSALLPIYNDAFAKHWAFNLLSMDEWLAALNGLDSVIPYELFTIAEYEGEIIGFILPEVDANQDLYNQRYGIDERITRIKLLVIAVKNDFQKTGVGRWILAYFIENVMQQGFEELSVSWIDEDNKKSLNLCTGLGGKVDKVYRVYRKEL